MDTVRDHPLDHLTHLQDTTQPGARSKEQGARSRTPLDPCLSEGAASALKSLTADWIFPTIQRGGDTEQRNQQLGPFTSIEEGLTHLSTLLTSMSPCLSAI